MYAREEPRHTRRDGGARPLRRLGAVPDAVPAPPDDGRRSALSAPENFIADSYLGRLRHRFFGRRRWPLLALAAALAVAGLALGVLPGIRTGQAPSREARAPESAAPPAPDPSPPRPLAEALASRIEAAPATTGIGTGTGTAPAGPKVTDLPTPLALVPEAAPAAPPMPAREEAKPAASRVPEPPRRDTARFDALVARGDALLAAGEVAAARLFYGRAAAEGDPRGARGMARSYDEAALRGLPGTALKGDAGEAGRWTRKAEELEAAR